MSDINITENNTPLPTTRDIIANWVSALGLPSESGVAATEDFLAALPSSALQWAADSGIPLETQTRAIAETLEIPFVQKLTTCRVSGEFIERIPIGFARQHSILGLESDEGPLRVVFGNPLHFHQLDVVSRFLNCEVEAAIAPSAEIQAAINIAYQKRTSQTQSLIESLDKNEVLAEFAAIESREDLLDVTDRAPVIKLVNMLLFEAVKNRASDVHIQPYRDRIVVRMRIDGLLFDSFELPSDYRDEVVSRIKIIGKMDIAEKRLPQDGRATVEVGDRLIDLRLASQPTSHGERVVIRLLDKSARLYTLGELGMDARALALFREVIHMEHGLILVTGPTGSGKSTTLYAALQEINHVDRNVVTLEDPIEYELDGISQTQVSDKKGMTFASALRSVLRQDPDIIMVGEIRDHETAVMAIQSALTGHLVFSTLHTNDACSAVTRLFDLGIEPYLVSSSLISVLAQRLVRRVCPDCGQPTSATDDEIQRLNIELGKFDNSTLKHGSGCENCRQTGYQGRIGIFELLTMSGEVRQKVEQKYNASQIMSVALANGMRTLHNDGVEKIHSGITTIEEVARITKPTVPTEDETRRNL